MSLSKEQSIEVNYRRDSFIDRVCDDLCEVILKYLSLEDRLRLECVSKQFQRTAFLSQRSLDLFANQISAEKLEPLLKKFQNLNEILFGRITNEMFKVIIKICNNLTHILFTTGDQIEKEVQNKFFDKFGHKLSSLDILCLNFSYTSIKAPNIEELTVNSFDSQLSQIKFNRLKKFEVIYLSKENINSFKVFIENNTKTLKYLNIKSYRTNKYNSHKRLLKSIRIANNLIHLSFDFKFSFSDEILTKFWKQIAINCKQIKSLRLHLEVNESLRINDEILSILKQFKQLKRLVLKLSYKEFDLPNVDFHPFKDLKGFEGLTHFSIRLFFIRKKTFKESLLTDIDINLPKLKTLKIGCPFIASEWTAQVLSRLTSLKTLELNLINREIRPLIERQLTKNCKYLKKVFI